MNRWTILNFSLVFFDVVFFSSDDDTEYQVIMSVCSKYVSYYILIVYLQYIVILSLLSRLHEENEPEKDRIERYGLMNCILIPHSGILWWLW